MSASGLCWEVHYTASEKALGSTAGSDLSYVLQKLDSRSGSYSEVAFSLKIRDYKMTHAGPSADSA